MQNKQEINNFIQNVFNYYNGRINICNYPAVLEINWSINNTSSAAGATRNPNIVTIFPRVIERYNANKDIYSYYFIIVETIIHELYHIDQVIDYSMLGSNEQYLNFIETAVEAQVYLYMINNTKEIIRIIGNSDVVNLFINNSDMYIFNYYPIVYLYNRRKYVDHLKILFSEVLGKDINFNYVLDRVIYNINNKIGSTNIYIDNNSLTVNNNEYLCSIELLNNFFYNNYFRYTYRENSVINSFYDKENNSITFKISLIGKNIMWN